MVILLPRHQVIENPALLLVLVEPVFLLGPHWHFPPPVETPKRVQSADGGVRRPTQVISLASLLLEGDSLHDDQEAKVT
jgi:hypothetical protein